MNYVLIKILICYYSSKRNTYCYYPNFRRMEFAWYFGPAFVYSTTRSNGRERADKVRWRRRLDYNFFKAFISSLNNLISSEFFVTIYFLGLTKLTLHVCEEGLRLTEEASHRLNRPISTWCMLLDLEGWFLLTIIYYLVTFLKMVFTTDYHHHSTVCLHL